MQASNQLDNPYNKLFFPTVEFPFYDIIYKLDASNASCEDINYLCACFSVGDSPEVKIPSYLSGRHKIPLSVRGTDPGIWALQNSFASSPSSSSSPDQEEDRVRVPHNPYDSLVGCKLFKPCLST